MANTQSSGIANISNLLDPSVVAGIPESIRSPELDEPAPFHIRKPGANDLLGPESKGGVDFAGAIDSLVNKFSEPQGKDSSTNISDMIKQAGEAQDGAKPLAIPEDKKPGGKAVLRSAVVSRAFGILEAFDNIDEATNIKMDQIEQGIQNDEFRSRFQAVRRNKNQIEGIFKTIDAIQRGAPGPNTQAQQFIRDPVTGRLLT